VVLEVALEHTDLSSRQLAEWITDNKGFSVSESTVYRLLNSQGLIKSPEMKMAAGKDFHAKATRLTRCGPLTLPTSESVDGASTTWLPSWMTFPWFVLAWRLQTDMTSDSFMRLSRTQSTSQA